MDNTFLHIGFGGILLLIAIVLIGWCENRKVDFLEIQIQEVNKKRTWETIGAPGRKYLDSIYINLIWTKDSIIWR